MTMPAKRILTTTTTPHFDFAEVKELILPRLPELLELLGLDYKEDYRTYYSICPIHDGDKPTALTIYKNSGVWRCFTQGCHEDHGQDIFSLVKAVLGLDNNGQALRWICNKLKITASKVDSTYTDKHSFASLINNPEPTQQEGPRLSRYTIRTSLTIPSAYYVKRGYTPSVLNEFDVGDCVRPGKPFYQRAVVPIYDNTWRYSIGFTARSIYEQCEHCKMHHDKILACPPEYSNLYAKWRNSLGFSKASTLFNYWRAKQTIEETSTAILVEGPGDCLRLYEAGVNNSVAIMGSDLSDFQQGILNESGAFDLVTLFDNDEAGEKAREIVKKKCGRLFSIRDLLPQGKDVGEMTVQEIRGILS